MGDLYTELSEKYAGITEGEEEYTSAPKRSTCPSDINPQNLQLSPGVDTPLAINKACTTWMGKQCIFFVDEIPQRIPAPMVQTDSACCLGLKSQSTV